MSTAHPLRVIQISDFHLQSAPGSRVWGVDVDAGLGAVLAHIQKHHPQPDFVLATGDLVGDQPEAYPRVRQALETLGVPVYCLPGNHDIPAAMGQALREGQVRWARYVEAESWQVVLLDSSVANSPTGYLAYRELTLLDTALAAHPERHTLVCLHHNPVPSGTAWLDTMMVGNHSALFALLDRHLQVRALAWGHIHAEFSDQRGALRLLGTPSTCVQFKPDSAVPEADALPPGYRWLELHADGTLHTGVERVEISVRTLALTRRVPA